MKESSYLKSAEPTKGVRIVFRCDSVMSNQWEKFNLCFVLIVKLLSGKGNEFIQFIARRGPLWGYSLLRIFIWDMGEFHCFDDRRVMDNEWTEEFLFWEWNNFCKWSLDWICPMFSPWYRVIQNSFFFRFCFCISSFEWKESVWSGGSFRQGGVLICIKWKVPNSFQEWNVPECSLSFSLCPRGNERKSKTLLKGARL